jgi:hypothetical protein
MHIYCRIKIYTFLYMVNRVYHRKKTGLSIRVTFYPQIILMCNDWTIEEKEQ